MDSRVEPSTESAPAGKQTAAECCGTEEKQVCCVPEEKSACCGTESKQSSKTGCGCR